MCRSLFEECNRAQMIDSVVYMEIKALTSLTPLKNQGHCHSPCSYKCRSMEMGLEQQRQELEQRNTTMESLSSKLFLSICAEDYE